MQTCFCSDVTCFVLGRFSDFATDTQLAVAVLCCAGASCPAAGLAEPADYLGARMAVAARPGAAGGITVAIAAKRGRIACLTASLDADGAAQLSSPVLYAVPAPQILGASYRLMQQRDMELGNVVDLLVMPAAEGQRAAGSMEHMAVLSHR